MPSLSPMADRPPGRAARAKPFRRSTSRYLGPCHSQVEPLSFSDLFCFLAAASAASRGRRNGDVTVVDGGALLLLPEMGLEILSSSKLRYRKVFALRSFNAY